MPQHFINKTFVFWVSLFSVIFCVSAQEPDVGQFTYEVPSRELNAEEIQKMLDAILNDIDDDDDEVIEKQELRDWIDENSKYLKKAKVDKLFQELDLNDDDEVSWKELSKTFDDEDEEFQKELFEAADEDDDRQLALDEYLKFRYPVDYPELKALLVKQILETEDENEDGKLSYQEFNNLLSDKETFDREDKDDDDFLDEEELGNAIVESVDEILDNTLEKLMKADDDEDGALSIAELSEEQELAGKTVLSKIGQKLIQDGKIKVEQDRTEL